MRQNNIKTQVWIDSDTVLEYKSELAAWLKYMALNEKHKPCAIVVPKHGRYEIYSKVLLKSCVVYSENNIYRIIGSIL